MKFSVFGGILALVGCTQLVSAGVTIHHVSLDGVVIEGAARGNGDLWGPAVAGSNRLKCGAFGNTETAAGRFEVKQSDSIELQLHVGDGHGGGKMTFEVSYGSNPNMERNPGFVLAENTISDDTSSELVTLPLSKLQYKNQATLMVSFTPTNQAEEGQTVSHHQCVDIDVTDGAARSVPPAGYGDPDRATPIAPAYVPGSNVPVAGGSLETVHWILIAVVIVLLLCLIGTWIKYKSPAEAPQQMEFAPQIAITEKVVAPVEPVEKKSAPPQKELSTSGSDQDPPPKAEAPPAEAAEDIQAEAGDAGDGSKGRHFHFRYVED